MRIVLAPVGTRGDVQPLIALGKALQRAKHDVTVCAATNFERLVTDNDLKFIDGGPDAETVIRQSGESVRNPIVFLKAGRAVLLTQFELLRRACVGADMLVGTLLLTLGPTVAEHLRIPFAWAGFFPHCAPTEEWPPPILPSVKHGARFNRVGWRVAGALTNVAVRGVVNRARKEVGLAPIADVFAASEAQPMIFAADPALSSAPRDWKWKHHQTGYWFLEQDAPLPADVDAFLQTQPVYIGFGSMPIDNVKRRMRIIVDGVRLSGRTALISSGWAGLSSDDLPASCKLVGALDHARLFPRVSATIHHGGAGTTSTAARAGSPQVIVPHMMDQTYWGDRVRALGLGPPSLPRNFTANALASAIRQVTEDSGFRERARLVSERMSDGTEAAVKLLEAIRG